MSVISMSKVNFFAKFNAAVDAKYIEWQKLMAPFKGTKIVTYHNDFLYFAERFKLDIVETLEPKPGISPSPAHIAQVIAKMNTEKDVILVQPYQNRKTAETVAGRTGAVVLDFPSFPGGPGTEGYLEWMDYLVKSTARGFTAQP